jgi:RHH-type proline utilization regulon transcriptional repressor/proline dehydrogenase/delta 1-pyrroline-5-carboxylate dehydrogenase
VGNLYVNRNMVGAVVGVQPFGGEGLSGTGPKAGGPLYLQRLLAQRPPGVLARVFDGVRAPAMPAALRELVEAHPGLADAARALAQASRSGCALALPGPTGERNVYTLAPRARVLCLAQSAEDLLVETAAVLASGGTALWPTALAHLRTQLPTLVQAQVLLQDNTLNDGTLQLDAVLHHGDAPSLQAVCTALARRTGPIVGVTALQPGATDIPLERLLIERALSVNTAAAGGNASLMTIG